MDGLQRLQLDLGFALRSALSLKDIMVQELRPRSEEDATTVVGGINSALAGLVSDTPRKGIAILIPLPAFDITKGDYPAPYGELKPTVQILEKVMVNEGDEGTGMSCEGVAIEVMRRCHHFMLRPNQTLEVERIEPITIDPEQEWDADIAYQVLLKVRGGFDALPQCAVPSITVASDVRVESSTTGAVCLVTLDGSLPCPANPASVPYDGPFPLPPPGTFIRAAAYKTGLDGSSANCAIIPTA